MNSLFEDLKEGLEEAIEMERCDFCKDIYDIDDFQEKWKKDHWDWMGTYLLRQKDGSINIFVSLDDWYYNTNAVYNVKYCPCCGRKLV